MVQTCLNIVILRVSREVYWVGGTTELRIDLFIYIRLHAEFVALSESLAPMGLRSPSRRAQHVTDRWSAVAQLDVADILPRKYIPFMRTP